MHWPPRRFQAAQGDEAGAAAGGAFSAPPPPTKPADSGAPSHLSAPPPAVPPLPPLQDSYEAMDFSKYSTSVNETDGLRDMQLAQRERGGGFDGYLIQHPRARQCIANIQLGAKMGASVGGCFGLLTGLYVAVTQRNLLVLPVSVIGGAVSFGFFLGCGMIIRCEENQCAKTQSLCGIRCPPQARPPQFAAAALWRPPPPTLLWRPPRAAGLLPVARSDISA